MVKYALFPFGTSSPSSTQVPSDPYPRRDRMLRGGKMYPKVTLVAISMKSTPMVLLTKGNDREARKLHSITKQSVPLAMNWMLNGPVMLSRFATALAASCHMISIRHQTWQTRQVVSTQANSIQGQVQELANTIVQRPLLGKVWP